MIVLALNPGSSSLRFELFRGLPGGGDALERLAGGRIGSIGARARVHAGRGAERPSLGEREMADHSAATAFALRWLREQGAPDAARELDGAGVRVVRGARDRDVAPLSEPELAELEDLARVAPLHNRPTVSVARAARAELADGAPLLGVSDSAFHRTMPEVAKSYALPRELCARHGLERTGFHGLAVASVLERFAAAGGAGRRIVVLHLGSGCSATAVLEGSSVDTSMGFSPLEGLVMATRSGDVDPALVPFLARAEGIDAAQVLALLNERSGLLGVSGRSADMRDILRARKDGDRASALAFDLFVHRARKHLAGMVASLGGIDALLFSGGIGENSAEVREAIGSGLDFCGIALERGRNAALAGEGTISPRGARVLVQVVAPDEELAIARATLAHLAERLASKGP
ncbi:MAG TPA: acetate/propionate family kinase [Planctomycetota bacterium]|nr:acetate/propionate family kinase [Planctomycetota bacterium]